MARSDHDTRPNLRITGRLRRVSDHGGGVDPHRPSIARMYDYWLGGKDHFPADRDLAERTAAILPESPRLAQANRRFMTRAVRFLAERGVTQYIDLGTGLPTSPNVHEIARDVHPGARVVYVDNDPMVVAHSRAMSTTGGIVTVHADIRHPEAILDDPGVRGLLDFDRPVAVLMVAVLNYLGRGDDAAAILRRYHERLARGSYLALSVVTDEGLPDEVRRRAQKLFGPSAIPAHAWSRAAVDDLLTAIDPVRPGVTPTTEWRADEPGPATRMLAAVGTFRR